MRRYGTKPLCNEAQKTPEVRSPDRPVSRDNGESEGAKRPRTEHKFEVTTLWMKRSRSHRCEYVQHQQRLRLLPAGVASLNRKISLDGNHPKNMLLTNLRKRCTSRHRHVPRQNSVRP
jgi:hypothetical protein